MNHPERRQYKLSMYVERFVLHSGSDFITTLFGTSSNGYLVEGLNQWAAAACMKNRVHSQRGIYEEKCRRDSALFFYFPYFIEDLSRRVLQGSSESLSL